MKILTPNQINKICRHVVETSEHYDIFLHSLFETLFLTGLRAGEVLDFSRWTVTPEGNLTVQTQKNSSPRIFKPEELSSVFADVILTNNIQLIRFNYKYIQRLFNRFSTYPQIFVGNKQVSTHLFRHNKAKRMLVEGYTDIQIQSYLGEKDLKNALNYINSDVYIP